ncbi:phage shock protein operon transcriptional activator [Catenovulum sp. SM1970]|uniref:phage shock protein operon transcriptional activator n=1 Tax=Marinifaba aquimaris TaxID=2741323 RepID=UPI001572A7BF|nr:phage shock protein operon transcriptional activator [Marinifaba aquimaris]NTS77815.1 phage shock protein operon transcriptional activator [Marinifaba aquimaris]
MNSTNTRDNLLGQSNHFLAVLDQVSRLAPLHKPVLIIGERGTGKELIAARLHYLSERWQQNYLSLNCAALNENLLESELFGHESGAFTGASKRHEGRFERANGGTLFLDELANTSSLVQEKLLRVIEYGEFERVGGAKTVKVDTRLIAATNEDLPSLVEQGRFRADLLDRLAFEVITLPPLRERQEDILMLADYFAVNMAKELEFEFFSGFSEKAKRTLLNYAWPGNIRELKNVIERSLYRLQSPHSPIRDVILDPFASPFRPTAQSLKTTASSTHAATQDIKEEESSEENEEKHIQTPVIHAADQINLTFPLNFKQKSQNFEIQMLKKALESAQFNQKKTAELLGVTYHQLRGYLKKYNLLDQDKQ